MLCSHCAVNCTVKGVDMNFKTLVTSTIFYDWLNQHYIDRFITLGGGEPTIHPEVLEITKYVLNNIEVDYVDMITNGKNTKIVNQLLKYNDRYPNFYFHLSQTKFHEPIQKNTVDNFQQRKQIHTIQPKDIIKAGRSKKGLLCCNTSTKRIVIDPKGNIKNCMCKNARIIGHLDKPNEWTKLFKKTKTQHSTWEKYTI